MGAAEWEGVARDLLETTGTDDPPVDAFEIAVRWGFRIERARGALGELDLESRTIRVDQRTRLERQHMSVAHELGHFGLELAELPNAEAGARYIGGALLLPRRAFDRDLVRTSWSISKLRAIHRNASATAIAVRIAQLREAVVTIVDPRGRKKPWRIWSPWIAETGLLGRLSAFERELSSRAYETRTEVRGDELCYAVPLVDHPTEHRVLVVCELEQLSSRL